MRGGWIGSSGSTTNQMTNIHDRFYLSGSNMIRGFLSRGLGPRAIGTFVMGRILS